ncbi:NADH dehydrogenase subunit 2 (mitochondrion) [Paramicrosporidium saccamoebae]|uniref:NADH-ubiquinone oxidoreductase chain 2 n=1 Tax=Paramicrosporidium saccamoebae TaxID=1246581 RepID=A0A2H9TR07_9FUNG|nr:NADH dehydrogenase subunit 2 [Paramicrosporidium saccamoebae]
MLYRDLHKIALTILLIGLINVYNILKEGIILNIPNVSERLGSLHCNINLIKIFIFITFIFILIFNLPNFSIISQETMKQNKVEYELILGLGLLGLIILGLSNDLIFLYLGLELYSFSIYFLILVKETLVLRKISIFYFIISSLSSALLLYSFSQLYKISGTLNMGEIKYLLGDISFANINLLIYSIILVFLFKLGSGPFLFWLIRVYSDLEKKILWYQLLIPKLFFFILLLKFTTLMSETNKYFIFSIYIMAIISILFGSIGGLFQIKDNKLLSYSSILNTGYILLTFAILLFNYKITIGNSNIETDKYWLIYQYFFVYFLNLLGLFSVLFLFRRSSKVSAFNSFLLQPYFFFSFFIIILSFIGMPPFSGFFSKFYLFFSLFSYSNLTNLTLIIFIGSTLISSFLYLKFLFASSYSPLEEEYTTVLNTLFPNFYTYILSFTTILTIVYSFFLSSLLPFFILSFSI